MKRVWGIVGVLVVVAMLGALFASAALAQGPRGRVGAWGEGVGCGWRGVAPEAAQGSYGVCPGAGAWVDEDGDGVCDNFVDEDGDGVCDVNPGAGRWVDEDGDGVCDNAPAGGACGQYARRGAGMGGGCGRRW